MTKQYFLSSLEVIVELLNRYKVLQGLPPFQPLIPLVEKLNQKGGCGCNRNSLMQEYRPAFEKALRTITEQQFNVMKTLLKTERICYYKVMTNGELNLVCH